MIRAKAQRNPRTLDAPGRRLTEGTHPVLLRPRELAHFARPATERLPLAGGPMAFAAVDEVVPGQPTPSVRPLPLSALDDDRHRANRHALTAARAPFAGVALDRTRIVGVVNVTPDSFSDGGRYLTPERAIAHGCDMLEAGADILDVGGESTRPGAVPVAAADELRRVVPVIEALHQHGAVISVDTRNPETMLAAAAAGAAIVNDVTALSHSPDSARTAARSGLAVVLMHMRGTPPTMQVRPRYDHAPCEVYADLSRAVQRARAAGLPPHRIVVDPGLGFGKNQAHNLTLLTWLPMFHCLGHGLMVGASRKSIIGRLDRNAPVSDRLGGSLAIALHAASQGANLVRVHDVVETRQALRVWDALGRSMAEAAPGLDDRPRRA
ncbi:MAG: dihydropteroate synthase [Alphaproteobacteria bacterium]|nr:dihydropteroate synthase [Alphaproteobacteria bacterium]